MSDVTFQQLVVFSIGSEEYALADGAVHEVIRYTEPRSVASDVPWIRSVIGLRDKIIPIYDLASRMGIALPEPAARSPWSC
jgi:purine-binding chemotaxis protein CheW